jgi:hypothetical protein
MTDQRFPTRREDGSAEVAAVFAASLDQSQEAVDDALSAWRELVQDTDVFRELSAEPRVVSSEEGFRVVFDIRSGSQHWKGWAVALLRAIEERIGSGSSVGFFDVVAGRMHAASRRNLLDDGESE